MPYVPAEGLSFHHRGETGEGIRGGARGGAWELCVHIISRCLSMYQLKVSDVLLPPQVFLDARSQTAQSVITVHHHMNNGVDGCTKDS